MEAVRPAEMVIMTILGLVTLNSMALFNLIWTYLSKKPLGMQTCFDQMIKDLLVTSTACTLTSSLVTLGWGPFDLWPELAVAYIYAQTFVGIAMFTQMMMTVLVRYLSVFHSTVIDGIEEKTCKKTLRLANLIVSAGLSTYEYLADDFKKSQSYVHLTKIPNDHVEPLNAMSVNVIIVANLLAILVMHTRIEWSKSKFQLGMDYSFWTLRSIVSILFVCGILQLLWLLEFLFDDNDNYSYRRLKFHTMMSVFLFNLIPVILILRSPRIAEFAFNNYFKIGHHPSKKPILFAP